MSLNANSQNSAKTNNVNSAKSSTAKKISKEKISIKGDGLLLRKDVDYKIYSITQEEYNRYVITHDGDIGIHDILDVKNIILNSDLELLSDSLFYSVYFHKLTAETSGKRYGSFYIEIKANIKDLNEIYTNRKTLNTLLLTISQVEKYISSFKELYQGKAYLIEPLLSVEVKVLDIESKGASIGDVKAECDYAKKMLDNKK
jgi:hypothetical protein